MMGDYKSGDRVKVKHRKGTILLRSRFRTGGGWWGVHQSGRVVPIADGDIKGHAK